VVAGEFPSPSRAIASSTDFQKVSHTWRCCGLKACVPTGHRTLAAMKKDLIPFQLRNGTPGVARVSLISLHDGRTLVTCMDDDDEADAPVNMAAEDLFTDVCMKHELEPADVVWVEFNRERLHARGGALGGWELVTWGGRPGKSPRWQQMTEGDWRAIG